MYGCGDFAGGAASRRNSSFTVVLLSQVFGTAAALLAAPLLGSSALSPFDVLYGALAGLFGAFGLIVLYHGIARTPVAVVSPTAAVVGTLVPMIFGVAAGEAPSPLMWIGSGICIPAIIMLSYEGSDAVGFQNVKKAVQYGLVAGLGFGGFFIAISRPSPDAGLWPLVAARCASVVAVFIVSHARKSTIKPAPGTLGIIAAAGLFDMGANIAFMLAAQRGMLIVVSVITSLYPAPTVLLARIFFGQKLRKRRIAGLVLALIGIACISAG